MSDVNVNIIIEMKADIASIKSTLDTMVNTNNTAIKSWESVQSAHHRLNKLEKDMEKLEDGQNWLPKLITACVMTTIVGGLVGFAVSKMIV